MKLKYTYSPDDLRRLIHAELTAAGYAVSTEDVLLSLDVEVEVTVELPGLAPLRPTPPAPPAPSAPPSPRGRQQVDPAPRPAPPDADSKKDRVSSKWRSTDVDGDPRDVVIDIDRPPPRRVYDLLAPELQAQEVPRPVTPQIDWSDPAALDFIGRE